MHPTTATAAELPGALLAGENGFLDLPPTILAAPA